MMLSYGGYGHVPHVPLASPYSMMHAASGRLSAGATDGASITLLTHAEHRMAGELVLNMQNAMQAVPQPLLELAMKDPQFRRVHDKGGGKKSAGRGGGGGGGQGRGRGRGLGGSGLGFAKEEPAPGAGTGTPQSRARQGASSASEAGAGGGCGGERKAAAAVMTSMMGARFKSGFVAASGGGLVAGTGAEVVAPKGGWKVTREEMESKPLPPPRPTNAVQAAASQFLAGMGMGMGMGGMGMGAPQPNVAAQTAAAAAAAARINAVRQITKDRSCNLRA